jgi:CHASE2 domain-containing sensor protein
MRYLDFDISIDDRTPKGYPLRADSALFGQARSFLQAGPDSPEIQNALTLLETRDTDRGDLVRFGTYLYKLLFVDEIETIFQQSYGNIHGEKDVGLRIRLRIQPPEMSVLPWELIFLTAADCFMGASRRTSLVRYIETNRPIPVLETRFPLRILVAIPNSVAPYPELDSKIERKNLEDALKGLEKNVSITFLDGTVSLVRINDALMDHPYHCFHFIGHGEFEDEKGMILLNTEDGEIDIVGDDRFSDIFLNHPSMKLVVLNSCKGAETSSIKYFAGMAPRLVNRGIPAVIAMRYPIMDRAAVLFAREFYRKLFKGWDTGRVDVAIAHARNCLAGEFSSQREICTPVLFLRAKNGVLFNSVTGNDILDIPFSNQALDRSKAVAQTYRDNLKIQKSPVDEAGLSRQVRLMKLRKYAQMVTVASVIFMFFLSWVNFFDLINLDTTIETYTLYFADRFRTKKFNTSIAVVTIEDASFGPSWRKEKLPVLVETLSHAGAGVIVFDMVFEKATDADNTFADAILKARRAGTKVVVGIRDADADGPKLIEPVMQAVTGFGITCIGRRLGRSRTAPLAVVTEVSPKKGDGSKTVSHELYSLSLVAYASFRGLKILETDLKQMHIRLLSGDNRTETLAFAELTRVRNKQACRIIRADDTVADIILDPYPLEILRKKGRRFSYDDVIKQPLPKAVKHLKGKIVLVGALAGDTFWENRGFKEESRFGVEFHAEALNTLVNGVAIRSVGMTGQIMFMIVLGICGAFIRSRMIQTPVWARMAVAGLVHAAYFFCAIFFYARYCLLLNTLYHLGAFWLSYGATSFLEKKIMPDVTKPIYQKG